jgi:hypothetical protein
MSVKTNSVISSQNLNSLDGEWNNLALKFAPILSMLNFFSSEYDREAYRGKFIFV